MRYIFVIILFFSFSADAQKRSCKLINIGIEILYDTSAISLDSTYFNLANDSILFTNIKFYLSNIYFTNNNRKVYTEKSSYHLVDIKNINSLLLQIKMPENISYDSIHFTVGIDSLTSAKGVGNADLDPTKGMYWAWHSGYINCKIEGKSNVCKTRANMFEFHLGGFLNGFEAAQKLSFAANNKSLELVFDVRKFFMQINLAETNMIMTPGLKSVELSQKLKTCFNIH